MTVGNKVAIKWILKVARGRGDSSVNALSHNLKFSCRYKFQFLLVTSTLATKLKCFHLTNVAIKPKMLSEIALFTPSLGRICRPCRGLED